MVSRIQVREGECRRVVRRWVAEVAVKERDWEPKRRMVGRGLGWGVECEAMVLGVEMEPGLGLGVSSETIVLIVEIYGMVRCLETRGVQDKSWMIRLRLGVLWGQSAIPNLGWKSPYMDCSKSSGSMLRGRVTESLLQDKVCEISYAVAEKHAL